jgi:hypothetical protein
MWKTMTCRQLDGKSSSKGQIQGRVRGPGGAAAEQPRGKCGPKDWDEDEYDSIMYHVLDGVLAEVHLTRLSLSRRFQSRRRLISVEPEF